MRVIEPCEATELILKDVVLSFTTVSTVLEDARHTCVDSALDAFKNSITINQIAAYSTN